MTYTNHIYDYYRNQAMSVPYGAGNTDEKMKIKYWLAIAMMHSYSR